MRYKVERPSIGVTSKCSLYEHEQFEKLCKKYGVTMYKGINLLIRLAITKGALPISYDYENKDHLKKEPIPEDAEIIDIFKFIRLVEQGSINEGEGKGNVSDGEYMYFDIVCDINWLTDQSKHYKYVCWFNK